MRKRAHTRFYCSNRHRVNFSHSPIYGLAAGAERGAQTHLLFYQIQKQKLSHLNIVSLWFGVGIQVRSLFLTDDDTAVSDLHIFYSH